MLVKFRDQNKTEVEAPKQVLTDEDIERLSIEAGKLEAQEQKKVYVPTQDDLDKLEQYLDNLTKSKLEPLNVEEPPKPTKTTKRGSKPKVTPTLLEDTLLSDDVITPKPKTARKKKMNLTLSELSDLNDNSNEVNRLTYRKRDAEDNEL